MPTFLLRLPSDRREATASTRASAITYTRCAATRARASSIGQPAVGFYAQRFASWRTASPLRLHTPGRHAHAGRRILCPPTVPGLDSLGLHENTARAERRDFRASGTPGSRRRSRHTAGGGVFGGRRAAPRNVTPRRRPRSPRELHHSHSARSDRNGLMNRLSSVPVHAPTARLAAPNGVPIKRRADDVSPRASPPQLTGACLSRPKAPAARPSDLRAHDQRGAAVFSVQPPTPVPG